MVKVSVNKIGWLRARISRTFEGKIKLQLLKRLRQAKYYISITVELPDIKIKHKPIKAYTAVGLILELKRLQRFQMGKKLKIQSILKSNLKRLKVLSKE